MSDSTQAAETQASFSRLFLSLLPFDDVTVLLRGLAELWQDVTRSRIAIVFQNANSAAPSIGVSPQNIASDDLVQELMLLNDIALARDGVSNFDVRINDETIGRIVLVDAETRSSELVNESLDSTARLLKQASFPISKSDFEQRKLESLAEFAAGSGHEINNPVATITGRASLLLKNESDVERRRSLTTIAGQAYRIRDMIGDLMLIGRPPQPEIEQLQFGDVVRDVVSKFEDPGDSIAHDFELQIADSDSVYADPVQLRIVLSELIQNAINAVEEKASITIIAQASNDPRFLRISVVDGGSGLSPIDQEHLFDPFYSGRQAGRGLGFGLCKCWTIVRNHGGRIEVTSDEESGTRFDVYWPSESIDSV